MGTLTTHLTKTNVPARWKDVQPIPRAASLSMQIEQALHIAWDNTPELRRLMETIDHESSVEGRWQIDEFRVADLLRGIAQKNPGLDDLRGAQLDKVIKTLRRLTKVRIPSLCRRLRYLAAVDEASALSSATTVTE
jgi:hypothetical protein